MCRYCEPEVVEAIISKTRDEDREIDETVTELYIDTDEIVIEDSKIPWLYYKAKINFCPMCGKILKPEN